MSIKHTLLALLAEEPTHGYELKRRYDEAMGALWPLQQAQIYNNLRLMEKAGLIEVEAHIEQENLPDRKNHQVTQAGHTELNEWLHSPLRGRRKLKDDFYLKITTLIKILNQPEAVFELLWKQREVYLHHLRDLEDALGKAESANDVVTAALLEGAILHTEADLTWLDRVEERLSTIGSNVNQGGGV